LSQKHQKKIRKCKVCAFDFPMTAAEIKTHAEKCASDKANEQALRNIGLSTHGKA